MIMLSGVQQPHGPPADRIDGGIGKPEEHAQVCGPGQCRPDLVGGRGPKAPGVTWRGIGNLASSVRIG